MYTPPTPVIDSLRKALSDAGPEVLEYTITDQEYRDMCAEYLSYTRHPVHFDENGPMYFYGKYHAILILRGNKRYKLEYEDVAGFI